jgi:hypothetical protein
MSMQVNLSAPSKQTLATLALGVALGLGLFAVGRHVHVPFPHFGPTPAPAPTPAPPAPAPAPKPEWFGLRYPDDGSARALIASMPTLSQSAPHLMRAVGDAADGRPILLYRAWTDLFRDYPPYPAQQIGDCVSFGHGHANDLLQCVEFCLANPGKTPTAADIQETDTEFIYGASREVSGNLGWQDGSYGGAAVKAMTTMGMVSRRMEGLEGAYSGRRAKQFGRTGPPAAWKQQALPFKLGAAARVTTWDELVAALHNGNPVTICTGMGFTLTRDSQGFASRKGRWGHCMFVAGARFDRPGACVVQSWGPEMPTGPTGLGQPPFSFWVSQQDIEAILAEGDSWALSKAPHFGAARTAAGHRRRLPERWRRGA